MGVATKVRDVNMKPGADQALYRLEPPHDEIEYVVVSACSPYDLGPETYIFPADESGAVVSWLEMTGSYKGGLDHAEALSGLGYEIRLDPAGAEK